LLDHHFDQLSFIVRADGTLLASDNHLRTQIGQAFGYKVGKNGMPPRFLKMFKGNRSPLPA